MNYKEEITKLIMASYDQGVKDAQQEALVALEKMVAIVRADEREACARLADERLMDTSALMSMPPKSSAAWSIAAAIRARGNT
jgi:hypothetical protein